MTYNLTAWDMVALSQGLKLLLQSPFCTNETAKQHAKALLDEVDKARGIVAVNEPISYVARRGKSITIAFENEEPMPPSLC